MARNVVIVGGGSAGWMTAAYLSKALENVGRITLVESDNVRTVGVGEATFSTLKLFFDFLGLSEREWMPACNATYKLAIRFVDWRARGGHFYHPFQRYDVVDGFNLGEWWQTLPDDRRPFDYSCFSIPELCDRQRSPRFLDGGVFDDKVGPLFAAEPAGRASVLSDHRAQLPYGYHMDASLLAGYLKGYAMARGVRRIVDDVESVTLDADGAIANVVTRDNGPIGGDLFVDCTGFRGLLINRALGEPFVSFSESLLCDSALAAQIPVDIETEGINPYTTATALSSGWVWNIPLYGRIGTGYVYSSAFQSHDEAERELRRHLGPAGETCPLNAVRMRIGRNRRSWVKNCVAIGLASGFVEPLESTGIFFIQHGIEELVQHFPDGPSGQVEARESYNRVVGDCIDGVKDFLALHYRASDRTDTPFWRATNETVLSAELAERLRLWRTRLPSVRSVNPKYHGFEFYSYSVMLLGLEYGPKGPLPVLRHVDPRNALAAFQAVQEKAHRLAQTLPSQLDYLKRLRTGAVAGPQYPRAVGVKKGSPAATLPMGSAPRATPVLRAG